MVNDSAKSVMQLAGIGVIRAPYKQPTGTPLQPVFAADTRGTVEVFP
jgi:hypothetical protein